MFELSSDKVMSKRFALISLVILTYFMSNFATTSLAEDVMRFPAPEFSTAYDFPDTTIPAPTTQTAQWIDVFLLTLALSVASWLAVKKRSRRGIFWLSIICLIYFGFIKQGCVCPIGSIQNVALGIFDSNYAIPMTVLLFFIIPLAFALFLGRVFCSSVCALGAIQDLVILKPINLPKKLTMALSMIPYIYLGSAILFAATNTGFIICRYDPFIGFFRLNGNAPYLYLGAGFLLSGVFIARPYCRFFCPYGVLLGWMSQFSRWHLAITPTECVDCRLCEASCPFDYIDKPNTGLDRENRETGVHRLGYLFAMIPVLVILGGWIGHRMSVPMSSYNNTVFLAEQVIAEQMDSALEPTLQTETYRSMGMSEDELLTKAALVRSRMNMGGWLLGGFLGLIFGVKLIKISTVRSRKDYEVHRSTCFSCARCCSYCPSDEMWKSNFVPGSEAYSQAMSLLEPGKFSESNTAKETVESKV
ncbi:MAG TPA: 4Fe-4S binding protein [Verrucomicrobiales bacterium]|nr:4Fe-4S binding protein [Verrucomicrobiales bacterium]